MGEISPDLPKHCAQVLGEGGRLTTAIPGFKARAQQIELAEAIAEAFVAQSTLVAEAGTGTGKTFAYLIPALLSGQKVLISTATKTLQDQLVQKDLPLLLNALALPLRVQNLKGRANYLCRYRVELHVEEGRFTDAKSAHDILRIQEKLPQLTHGERHELPEIHEESPAWPYVTSSIDNCLGRECAYHDTCFLMQARRRALDAHVVVINHHLFFADSRLKEDGFGELLPQVHAVIFDEAHQLAEIATHFHGTQFSSRQLRDLMDDMLREWPVLDLVNQPLSARRLQLDQRLDALLVALERFDDRIEWARIERQPPVHKAWQSLLEVIHAWAVDLNTLDMPDEPGLQRCHARLLVMQAQIQAFVTPMTPGIRWVERFKHTVVFHCTPFEVAASFQALLSRNQCAYIFTSATLTMSGSFDCFLKPLGLVAPQQMLLPSPFDFEGQALLYLPRGLPDPKDQRYHELLLQRALPIIEAYGGRCFFLFTSHRALKEVAFRLKNQLIYPLLVQGDEPKPILLNRFRESGNAVLLGTATFWEGVDVKGAALSCVIIDKLPFASPTDPVIRGKMSYLKTQGLSGFDHLSLPSAVLALKQGVGRLIRDVADCGVLMIADPRLTARPYGQSILASLPKMRKTRDEEIVLQFITSTEVC